MVVRSRSSLRSSSVCGRDMSHSCTAASRACVAARRPTAAQKTRLLNPATRGVHGAVGLGGAVLKCSFLASPWAGVLVLPEAVGAGASRSTAESAWAGRLPRAGSVAGVAEALGAPRVILGVRAGGACERPPAPTGPPGGGGARAGPGP
uniref:Uncharacterized protein n=1 Tax=Human herpesvirus 2 TaxID=10310 RepID=A0A481TZ64_HHV2|nr:hypothetical protein [Human alphaherpesvirus 2]